MGLFSILVILSFYAHDFQDSFFIYQGISFLLSITMFLFPCLNVAYINGLHLGGAYGVRSITLDIPRVVKQPLIPSSQSISIVFS